MIRFRAGIPLAFAIFLALGAAAHADSPPSMAPALASLEAMVQNLGYTTTETTNKKAFSITWNAKYNYVINFDLSQDGTLSYAYIDLGTYTATQLDKVNFTKLLEADDVGNFYFSMEHQTAGEKLYANAIISLAGLKPADLRGTLSGMVGKADASDALWNTSLWK